MPKRFIFAHTPGECSYEPCGRSIEDDHYLCPFHYARHRAGLIAECEGGCGRFLPAGYVYCAECGADDDAQGAVWPLSKARRNAGNGSGPAAEPKPAPESEPHWKNRDAHASRFWVYLLRLEAEGAGRSETAELYAGHTRELRCRMMDHFDGLCASTWNRGSELVWFAEVPSRDAATEAEAELKHQLVSDRRAVLRRIAEFQEVVALVSAYPPAGRRSAGDAAAADAA